MKTFSWLIKREFWEHRGGLLWAPIVTGGVFLLLNLMGIIAGEVLHGRHGSQFKSIDFAELSKHLDDKALTLASNALDTTMLAASSLIFLVMSVVVFFYCVNTLAEDRRDRSILFWKSLPLSDRSMVLSKVTTAVIVAPVIAMLVSVVAGLAMLLMVAIVGSLHGANLWQLLWTLPHPLRMAWMMLGTLPLYLVWALPTVGWLLLCSAWSRSRQFLWALAVPLGAGIMVGWFQMMGLVERASWFWSHIVARSLLSIVPGSWLVGHGELMRGQMESPDKNLIVDAIGLHNQYPLLATPQFWVGAIVGITMIAGAIWLRRWRTQM